MNLTKRIISSALVLSMATLTIPVEAYATSNTIKGQVFFEDGSPAAGVKINILSSNIDEVYDDCVDENRFLSADAEHINPERNDVFKHGNDC